MEVFGIGPFELLLVILIAFVVLGPEKIPGAARTVGRTIRQIRQAVQTMLTTESGEKISIPRELAELQRDLSSLRTDLNRMAQQIITPADQPSQPTSPAATPSPQATSSSDTDIIDMGAPPPA
jgi:sec-independent protein translocase protein TatB